jgi:hypothetical protein
MSNLKPFDLARWKAGDEVMYRDGKAILDMHYFNHEQLIFPIHALAWDGAFTEHLSDGAFNRWGGCHPRDIVMKPKKTTYYLATYKYPQGEPHISAPYKEQKDRDDIYNAWIKYPIASVTKHQIEIEE